MTLRSIAPLLALGCLLGTAGCSVSLSAEASLYVRPRSFVRVTSACPAPKTEADGRYERASRPDPNALWVAGHWTWESGWVWVSGRWVVPRPGYVWEPPVCVAREGSFRFYPGYYRGRQEEPPRVYREPGHIRVHRPSDEDERLPPRVVVRPGEPPPTNTGPDAELRGEQDTAHTTVGTSGGDDDGSNDDGSNDDGSNDDGSDDDGSDDDGSNDDGSNDDGSDSDARGPQDSANTSVNAGPLECSVRVRRVPRGGYVQISGRGFSGRVVVMISGNTAEIRTRTATAISARASRSGEVKVIRGDEQASCGRITIF